jgi:hypothetical protein
MALTEHEATEAALLYKSLSILRTAKRRLAKAKQASRMKLDLYYITGEISSDSRVWAVSTYKDTPIPIPLDRDDIESILADKEQKLELRLLKLGFDPE